MPWIWLRSPARAVDIALTVENNCAEGSPVVRQGVWSMRSVAGLFVVGVVAGCSFVVDADRIQCSKDSDCEGRGEEFSGSVCSLEEKVCVGEPRWSCLDETPEPPPESGKFEAPFLVRHLVTQAPLPGIHARLCRRIDVACSDPLGEDLVTDAQGKITFEVDAGFEGYALFEAPEIAHGLYFFNPAVQRDLPVATLSIGNSDVIGLLARQAGATQGRDRAVVLLSTQDCSGTPAEGITLSAVGADPDAVPFYSEQGLPSGSASQTDSAGYGGLLNVEAGSVTFTATIAKTQRRLGQITVLAREGAITYGNIVPHGL
jgi:hypothetical protein